MDPLLPRLGDRSLFPELQPSVYLNHAAISPPSLAVQRAAAEVLSSYATEGVGAALRWFEQRGALKADLAALIGAAPEDIGLVANTTAGVVAVALCMPWRRGESIVVFDGEFPTNVTPWQQAAHTSGLTLQRLPLAGFADGSGDGLAAVEAALRGGGVRLVAVSAVQFQTGLRMPLAELAELAHAHGAQLFVDGIQAVGVVPLDVAALGIDYLACGSHKWLMGLEGCGFLYVSPARIDALVPRVAGWLSHEEPLGFLFDGPGHLRYDRPIRARADFVEAGAPNTLGLATLQASVGLLAQLGVPEIYAHVQAYHDALEPLLLQRGFTSLRASDPGARSGILSALPPAGRSDPEVVAALAGQGVAVTNPDGVVRFSPHWPNGLHELPRVQAALDALSS